MDVNEKTISWCVLINCWGVCLLASRNQNCRQ